MYQFHYQYIKKKLNNIQALYSDTDSIVYHIKTEDLYKDISSHVNEWFDTSGYEISKDRIALGVNKKLFGKFKDETGDQVISHFCANWSESYSLKVNNEEVSKNTSKGIVKAARTKQITFEDYKMCF